MISLAILALAPLTTDLSEVLARNDKKLSGKAEEAISRVIDMTPSTGSDGRPWKDADLAIVRNVKGAIENGLIFCAAGAIRLRGPIETVNEKDIRNAIGECPLILNSYVKISRLVEYKSVSQDKGGDYEIVKPVVDYIMIHFAEANDLSAFASSLKSRSQIGEVRSDRPAPRSSTEINSQISQHKEGNLKDPYPQISESPFMAVEQRISSSSPSVLYIIIKSVYNNLDMTEREFSFMKPNGQVEFAVKAYYLNICVNLMKMRHDSRLVDILEKFDENPREIALAYEKKYFEIYGKYPINYTFIDIDRLENRVLKSGIIR